MKSRLVRLHSRGELRIDEVELPPLKNGEVLLAVKCCAICTSCHKTAILAEDHHRVPSNLSDNPIVLGHELSGTIVKVSEGVDSRYTVGGDYVLQPMVYQDGSEVEAVGHSYSLVGGYATYIVVNRELVVSGSLIPWGDEAFYKGALAEPLGCIIAAWRSQYHTVRGSYKPIHGHRKGGRTLLLAGSGTMGFFTALLWQIKADSDSTLTVHGRDHERLSMIDNYFRDDSRVSILSNDELVSATVVEKFDDIVIFYASNELVELGLSLLSYDGCLNMFAGPLSENFSVDVNFHAVHYKRHHIVGSSGASQEDMERAVEILDSGAIDPSFLVTHIGGLNSVEHSVLNLPTLGSGKKLIYPHIDFPLTAIDAVGELAEVDSRFRILSKLLELDGHIWSRRAEEELLKIK